MSPQQTAHNLKTLQKNAGKWRDLAKQSSTPIGAIKTVLNIFKQMDLSRDWMFVPILVSFALLKDIFDIAFAAIPGVGIALQFITEIMLMILAVTALLLAGDSLKNRGMAKYFLGMAVAFISEALPGIGWLPLSVIEMFILYGFVLFDRVAASKEQKKAEEKPAQAQQPDRVPQLSAYAAADNYYADERKAA